MVSLRRTCHVCRRFNYRDVALTTTSPPPPSRAEVKERLDYTSIPPLGFMAYSRVNFICLIVLTAMIHYSDIIAVLQSLG